MSAICASLCHSDGGAAAPASLLLGSVAHEIIIVNIREVDCISSEREREGRRYSVPIKGHAFALMGKIRPVVEKIYKNLGTVNSFGKCPNFVIWKHANG